MFPSCLGAPRREPENPSEYGRREEYEGERVQRGRGKNVSLPMSLKFDGKSNWKAFYAKWVSSSWTFRVIPTWAVLSPFPLPLILLSPLDDSRGFMFPS
jgi:hypothetical protein